MMDEIVRRCQEGERSAFHDLFRIHGGMIQKISMRMTRNAEWQKDIFQDVVMQVIRNIHGFRGECKFTTWLYRITVNASLRHLRQEAGHSGTPFDESVLDYGAAEESLSRLMQQERERRVVRALAALPRKYREILSWFYFAEMSVREIAELTGKSGGAVKVLLWKGRRALERGIKPEANGD